jgi:hypothetical protein
MKMGVCSSRHTSAILDYTERLYAYAFHTKKAELATKDAELANL